MSMRVPPWGPIFYFRLYFLCSFSVYFFIILLWGDINKQNPIIMNIKMLFYSYCICKNNPGPGRHTAGAYYLLAQFIPKFPETA